MDSTRLTPEEIARIERAVERQARTAALRVLRRYRNEAVVAFAILLAGISYAVYGINQSTQRARGVVCRAMYGGERALYAYVQDGTITQAQLRRELGHGAEARKSLLPADNCPQGIAPPPSR